MNNKDGVDAEPSDGDHEDVPPGWKRWWDYHVATIVQKVGSSSHNIVITYVDHLVATEADGTTPACMDVYIIQSFIE